MRGPRREWCIGCLLAAALAAGCAATIGTPNPELLGKMSAAREFGAEQTVRLCGLLDRGMTEAAVRNLVDEAWNRTEAGALALRIELVSAQPLERGSLDIETLFGSIRRMPLPAGCDRIFAFIDPADDLITTQVGGVSLIHGFALATPHGTRQALLTPAEVVRHEFYHLIGCGHAAVMDECYRRIARAKTTRNAADAFFPVFMYILDEDIRKNCGENRLIVERAEANRIAQRWAEEGERTASGTGAPARRCGT